MEELMNLLVEYFKHNNKGFQEKELRKHFDIKGEKQTDIFLYGQTVPMIR